MAKGVGYQIKFEDNSDVFKADYKRKKMKMTWALGLKWQELATKIITANRIVDTGRLRASLSFVTPYKSSGENQFAPKPENAKNTDRLRGTSGEQNIVIVGSNVEYAAKQELNNPKGSFVKPAIMNYRDAYKNLLEQIMKE